MWEISEGHTKLIYIMKLMPPKDLGFWEFKVSKCRKLSVQVLFNRLVLGDFSIMSNIDLKKKEEKKPLSVHQNKSCTLQTP